MIFDSSVCPAGRPVCRADSVVLALLEDCKAGFRLESACKTASAQVTEAGYGCAFDQRTKVCSPFTPASESCSYYGGYFDTHGYSFMCLGLSCSDCLSKSASCDFCRSSEDSINNCFPKEKPGRTECSYNGLKPNAVTDVAECSQLDDPDFSVSAPEGRVGSRGAAGADGSDGADGADGAAGAAGERGVAGAAGAAGAAGERGSAGSDGGRGQKGASGDAGVAGAPGSDKSGSSVPMVLAVLGLLTAVFVAVAFFLWVRARQNFGNRSGNSDLSNMMLDDRL
jgi:hypothetical protein